MKPRNLVLISLFFFVLLVYFGSRFLFYHQTLGILSKQTSSFTHRGVNWFRVGGFQVGSLEHRSSFPIQVDLDKAVFRTKLIPFVFSDEKEIKVSFAGGTVVFGSREKPLEGYEGERFTVKPFELKIQMKGGETFVSPLALFVSGLGRFTAEGKFSRDDLFLEVDCQMDQNFLSNAPNPFFLSYAFSLEEGGRRLSLKLDGPRELPAVSVKTKLFKLSLKYPLDIF